MVKKDVLLKKLISVWNGQASKLVMEKDFNKARQILIEEAYEYFKDSLSKSDSPREVYICHKNTFEVWEEFCLYVLHIRMFFPNKQDIENFAKNIKRFSVDFYILNSSKNIGAYLYLKKLYE